uniref:Uncharacterized protein n=1 Tax=Branchiostoma floridae TaxID=7739 RepID=C3ZBI3_BRAFL|eukprot:XP_002594209.1 hypothetical protein BRAFLDRAFT_65058 [Branchiostoma floridae]
MTRLGQRPSVQVVFHATFDPTLQILLNLLYQGHTFVWQAFFGGVSSQLIFERGPNNTSAVDTPPKFSVRCSSGLAGSLCCNLTIHNVVPEDLGQPITCYGYRFDHSEPGQDRSPSVFLTNGADETPRRGLSGKMIGLVVAAAKPPTYASPKEAANSVLWTGGTRKANSLSWSQALTLMPALDEQLLREF